MELDSISFDQFIRNANPFKDFNPEFDLNGYTLVTPTSIVSLSALVRYFAQGNVRPLIKVFDQQVRGYLIRSRFVEAVSQYCDFDPPISISEIILNEVPRGNNNELFDIGGVSNSVTTMSVENCSIVKLAPLKYTSIGILWCNGNQLTELPELPPTMSFVNCSNNLQLSTLPDYLPYGLTKFIASYTNISTLPLILPDTLVTMSVYNTALTTWIPSLPPTLTYLDCHSTHLTSIPSLPPTILYLDISYCNMTDAVMNNICTLLITYGLTHGTLILMGNDVYSSGTLTKITTLQGKSWTVNF